jgi:hypothetical protein
MDRFLYRGFAALGLTVLVTAGLLPGEASAASRSAYCSRYAHDIADANARPADVVGGTIGGALTGAVIGGIIDGGKGAGRGALIGGVGGTVLGAAGTTDRWHRVYQGAYAECMDRYAAEPAYAAGPVPGTKAWYRYCSAKYRSFNPDTGMFLSSSGQYKPCR